MIAYRILLLTFVLIKVIKSQFRKSDDIFPNLTDPCQEVKKCAVFLPSSLYFEKMKLFQIPRDNPNSEELFNETILNEEDNVNTQCIFFDYANMVYIDFRNKTFTQNIFEYENKKEKEIINNITFTIRFCPDGDYSASEFKIDGTLGNVSYSYEFNGPDFFFEHRFTTLSSDTDKNLFFLFNRKNDLNGTVTPVNSTEDFVGDIYKNVEIFFSDKNTYDFSEEYYTGFISTDKDRNVSGKNFTIRNFIFSLNVTNLTESFIPTNNARIICFCLTYTVNKYAHYFASFLIFFGFFTILYGKNHKDIVYFFNGPIILYLVISEFQELIAAIEIINFDDLGMIVMYMIVCFGLFCGLLTTRFQILQKIQLSFFVIYSIYFVTFSIIILKANANIKYYLLSKILPFAILLIFLAPFCFFYDLKYKLITNLLILFQGCFDILIAFNLIGGSLPFFPILALAKQVKINEENKGRKKYGKLFDKLTGNEVYRDSILIYFATLLIIFAVGLGLSYLLTENEEAYNPKDRTESDYRDSNIPEKEKEEEKESNEILDQLQKDEDESDDGLKDDENGDVSNSKEGHDDNTFSKEDESDDKVAEDNKKYTQPRFNDNDTSGRLSEYCGLGD